MSHFVSRAACIGLVLAVAGCTQDSKKLSSSSDTDPAKYTLTREPEGAQGVRKVRKEAEDQDKVVVVGRIGGSTDPWIDGLAAFTIVDPAMKHCHEMADDNCAQPWDFC